MIDYAWIKSRATRTRHNKTGYTADDLIVLDKSNDPFYAPGLSRNNEWAHWGAELYNKYTPGQIFHIRRMHYVLISVEPRVIMPDGNPYINIDKCYAYLNTVIRDARYLGLIPYENVVDRRNPDPVILTNWADPNAFDYRSPEPSYSVYSDSDRWGYSIDQPARLDSLPSDLPRLPDFSVGGYDTIEQDYQVEVFVEKSTMNDILVPLCTELNANLITGVGNLSLTAVIKLLYRTNNKRIRILYISDYDKNGLNMPREIARKIEYMQRNEGYGHLDIELEPIILDADQVIAYDLPLIPSKSKKGAVELDALEALHPGELDRIVRQAILQYHDPTLRQRARDVKSGLTSRLSERRASVVASHRAKIEVIGREYDHLLDDYETVRQRYDQLLAQLQDDLDSRQNMLDEILDKWDDLCSEMSDELESIYVDLDDYALPEVELSETLPDPLYSSERDYMTQLAIYKHHKAEQERKDAIIQERFANSG